MKTAVLLILPLLVLMGSDGCKRGEGVESSGSDMPSDLTIIFGRQGTFAGRSMGYTIRADGEVVRWEGKYPGEIRQATGTAPAEDVRRLWKEIEAIEFLEMQDQAMSTVHTFITVQAGGESRRVTWVDRDESAPTPAQKLFDACTEVAEGAIGE